MAWQNSWTVLVDGKDISTGLRPYLIDISVTDKEGTSSDTCAITVDDEGGQFRLPNEESTIVARLNGVKVFEGIVDSVRSSGSRGGGRTLKIDAKGYDTKGKAKELQSHHKDDATLEEFLGEAAKRAGYSLTVDPDLAEITRDYWAADNENFLHLGQRLARELNATFKLRGTQAVLVPKGKDFGLPPISAAVGSNLINWDIAPLMGRTAFKRTKARFFDREQAKFRDVEVQVETDRPTDTASIVQTPAADESHAKSLADGRKSETEQGGGEGSVTIDAAPEAQAEGTLILTGSRPGVDGTYRIASVTHSGSRSAGTTTRLELKQPQGTAGKDNR